MSSSDCIFCKIVAGDIPCRSIYEDDWLLSFYDIHPVTPIHALVIPKQHLTSLDDLAGTDRSLAGVLLERTAFIARQLGIASSGYRTIVNTGSDGGQEVAHLHLHLLGGGRVGPMVARHP
ncbi:MAG: histidine triad nucleotide-binding protein [Magnetococcales bacterium]|nr:histidine triad nucleotide-binding protein [Magnetococcales bacterium]